MVVVVVVVVLVAYSCLFHVFLTFEAVWINLALYLKCSINKFGFNLSDRKESTSTGPTKFEVQIVAQFDNHNSQVWRVSWNITSTLLASSGDDGCVRLWKGEQAAVIDAYCILRVGGARLTGEKLKSRSVCILLIQQKHYIFNLLVNLNKMLVLCF